MATATEKMNWPRDFTFKVTKEEAKRYERDPLRWIRQKVAASEYHDALVHNVRCLAQARGWNEEEFMLVLTWAALSSREDVLDALRERSNQHADMIVFKDALSVIGGAL